MPSKVPAPKINNPALVKQELVNFVDRINAQRKAEHEKRFPSLDFTPITIGGGRKYIQLWRDATPTGGQKSIFSFVRAADGAILMPATWRAPALNLIRGYIFVKDVTLAAKKGGYSLWC